MPAAASAAVSSSRRRSPPWAPSPVVCRSKIAVRISRTVVVELLHAPAGSGAATAGSCDAAQRALQLQTGGEQPLDDVVVQVAGDPVAVGEHVELALGPVLLPQLQSQRGLLGERGQQRHLARVERGPARRAAARPARRSPSRGRRAARRRSIRTPGDGTVDQQVSRRTRPARPCGSPRPRAGADRARASRRRPGSSSARPARGRRSRRRRVGPQHDDVSRPTRQLQRALRDQAQRVLLARAGQQLVPDLRRRLQPLLPQPALLEQVRVLHRDPGRRGEGLDDDLVVAR